MSAEPDELGALRTQTRLFFHVKKPHVDSNRGDELVFVSQIAFACPSSPAWFTSLSALNLLRTAENYTNDLLQH